MLYLFVSVFEAIAAAVMVSTGDYAYATFFGLAAIIALSMFIVEGVR